jgi:hypothetical protein
MNRCSTPLFLRAALCLTLAWAGSASAQHFAPDGQRTFPVDVERGELTVLQGTVVQMGRAQEQLAPGARIFNLHNRVQLPVTLAGQKMVVNFRRNGMGQISEVWLLSSQEAQTAPRKNPAQRKAFPSLAERQRVVDAANGVVRSTPSPVPTAVLTPAATPVATRSPDGVTKP